MKKGKLMLGDNIELLKKLPENSIDSVVTDGPYGLSFMGKKWDYDVPSVEFWQEVYRVLKPGGHLLSFGGTRTYHRMVVNIEDAGFEIRDQIQWLYGSGFPKSLNVGKAVDKLEGNERKIIGTKNDFALDGIVRKPERHKPMNETINSDQEYGYKQGWETPVTKGQSEWEGWGSALKPANEPICLARKPLSEKSIAENVLKWKTGGLNIDGCRVGYTNEDKDRLDFDRPRVRKEQKEYFGNTLENNYFTNDEHKEYNTEGRFPANLILDESAAEMLDEQSGILNKQAKCKTDNKSGWQNDYVGGNGVNPVERKLYLNDNGGGASRFFYVAKVSKAERNMGLDEFEENTSNTKGHGLDRVCMNEGCGVSMLKPQDCKCDEPDWRVKPKKNSHPTVKPVNLMSYLCKLITPPNGIVLDPFMGSGSTGIAALLNDFKFVGMEMDNDYFKIAESRINSYEEYRKFLKK